MLNVKRYTSVDKEEWNQFIDTANNSTFLFNRDFMDYHSDRFADHSVMVYDKDKLICCFPANITKDNKVISHQGLTYGGFCMKPESKLPVQLKVYKSILEYYYSRSIITLIYKAFPRFYNKLQTDELEYALFLSDAKLIRRDTALAIEIKNRIEYAKAYERQGKKAIKNKIEIVRSDDYEGFWNNVLVPNLKDRFGVLPVHSLEEITTLKRNFEHNIHLFLARDQNMKTIAGTVIFETKTTAHSQYISANTEGRDTGALNLLFIKLIDDFYCEKPFFDFGIANEDDGLNLNIGLLTWKERMGGRTYSHDFYEVKTENYKLISIE